MNDELIIEFKKTLEILYKQKDIITKNLENNKDYSNINSSLEQLLKIDENIKEYIIKIKDIEKINKDEEIKDLLPNKNLEKKKIHINLIITIKLVQINHKIPMKIYLKKKRNKELEIQIENDMIDDILKKEGKTKIKITIPKKNFETIYTFKNRSHNYYFFHCKNRPKCNGLAKFSLKDKKFYATKICNDSSIHNNISYDDFVNLFELKKLSLIDFNLKKNAKIFDNKNI